MLCYSDLTNTQTDTHTQSWLRSLGHLGLGLEAMTGRWRRDYSACLVSAFLPQFVCMSEKEEEEEKKIRETECIGLNVCSIIEK